MKYALRAAITALSIANIPPAMAGDSSLNPGTFFTRLPSAVAETATQSVRGPSLLPPIGKHLD